MLPKIDLPDLLFEVHFWTGFLDAFVHLGDGTTRMKDLSTSVVALLVPEVCNIGMTPVTNPVHEALTRSRLVHVDQFYLRADTIAAANAALIEAQSEVPIVQFWGDGLLASVDGLRFVVPVRTISAAPSPKYFGFRPCPMCGGGRGVRGDRRGVLTGCCRLERLAGRAPASRTRSARCADSRWLGVRGKTGWVQACAAGQGGGQAGGGGVDVAEFCRSTPSAPCAPLFPSRRAPNRNAWPSPCPLPTPTSSGRPPASCATKPSPSSWPSLSAEPTPPHPVRPQLPRS